jgi:aryl-alcohol dehydrogenase-like predicted oxidoreductase/RimJ/RimL family protein N-acetyltransferase
MVNKIFINNNIILKKLVLKDINENYLSWLSDTTLKKNLVNISFKNISLLKEYYKKTIKKKHLIFFGIFYKEKHIGNIKFENIFMNSAIASWGILIGDKNFRGRKIGYEVLSKSMNYLESKFNIKNFIISVSHYNLQAKKLYHNLGFRILKIKKDKIFLIKKCEFSKIILGSANFENDYGIRKKNIRKHEIKNILRCAKKYGINFIDTANNYGKSEEILGMNETNNFELTSKFSKVDKNIGVKKFIEKNLEETLKKTKTKQIYGYLAHNPNDLLSSKGKIIIKTLIHLKKQKLVKKIGVSVYEVKELKEILKVFKPDIVQLPINILNQSFLKNDYLKKIKELGIEIHVRSIFLQGILLENKIKNVNEIIDEKVKKIDKICFKKNITRLSFLLNFIKSIHEIDKIVVGIDSVNQLKKIIKYMQNPIKISNFKSLAVTDERIVDPRSWVKN